MQRLSRYFLEPMNTVTHLVAACGALAGTVILIWMSWGEWGKLLSLLIYGLTTTWLYIASTLFHGVKLSPSRRMILNRLDHASIFLMIAGTYTPIIYNLFPDSWRWPMLAVIWMIATAGLVYKLTSRRIHGLYNVSIYVMLGWGGVVPALWLDNLRDYIPLSGLLLILAGGLIYSAGFVVYYLKRPNLWPNFGHHELWHLFVMGGSLFHFLFLFWYVVPAA